MRYEAITNKDFEIAEQNGIKRQTVISRVRKGMSIEEAIVLPLIKQKTFTFTEEEKERINQSGILKETVYYRVAKKGMSLDEALSYGTGRKNNTAFIYRGQKLISYLNLTIFQHLYQNEFIEEPLYITIDTEEENFLILEVCIEVGQVFDYKFFLDNIKCKNDVLYEVENLIEEMKEEGILKNE